MRCPRCGNEKNFDTKYPPAIYCNSCGFRWDKEEDPKLEWASRARMYKKLTPPIWKDNWIDPDVQTSGEKTQ